MYGIHKIAFLYDYEINLCFYTKTYKIPDSRLKFFHKLSKAFTLASGLLKYSGLDGRGLRVGRVRSSGIPWLVVHEMYMKCFLHTGLHSDLNFLDFLQNMTKILIVHYGRIMNISGI